MVEGVVVYDFLFLSFFYVDIEDDMDESDELMFCKNNVCVYVNLILDDFYILGYFKLNLKIW